MKCLKSRIIGNFTPKLLLITFIVWRWVGSLGQVMLDFRILGQLMLDFRMLGHFMLDSSRSVDSRALETKGLRWTQ